MFKFWETRRLQYPESMKSDKGNGVTRGGILKKQGSTKRQEEIIESASNAVERTRDFISLLASFSGLLREANVKTDK